MVPAGEASLALPAVRRGDEQFVRPEMLLGRSGDGDAERVQHGFVEAPARGQIRHDQLDMVDQAPAFQSLGFHKRLPQIPMARAEPI